MKKRDASILLAFLMVTSSLAFVIAFLPAQPSRPKVEVRPVYESLTPEERDVLLYTYGMTIINYPSRDSFFNSTLSRLPQVTGNFVAISIGEEFSIESANGFRKTNESSWLKDLCELMVRGSLPDCVKFESGGG